MDKYPHAEQFRMLQVFPLKEVARNFQILQCGLCIVHGMQRGKKERLYSGDTKQTLPQLGNQG